MAEAWQTAFVEVVPSFKDFRGQANKTMLPALSDAGSQGAKGFGKGFATGIGSIGGPLLAAVAALGIGRAIGNTIGEGINFALDGIKLAGALAETESAVGQIFGKASQDVLDFAEGSASELGATRKEVLEGAKTFGIFGKPAKLRGPELAAFSTGLVSLATDLGSFNNTSTSEAIEAIGSALRGEAEPLRKYGVLLDDATLKEEALKLGLIDTMKQALTPQQKVLAAQSAIYAQTSTQQGDFARTSGSLSNQQKILAASFEEAKTRLGTALLPAMTSLATLANDKLIPILDKTVEQVGPILADALAQSIPAFGEMITAIAPLLPDLVRLGVEALPPILAVLVALAPAMVEWARATADTQGIVQSLMGFIAGNTSAEQLLAKIGGLSSGFLKFFRDVGGQIGYFINDVNVFTNRVKAKFDEVTSFFAALPGRIAGILGNLGSRLEASGRALMQGFIDGIKSQLGSVGSAIGGVMDFAAGFFPNSPAERGAFSGSGWAAIGKAGGAIFDEFQAGMPSATVSPLGSMVSVPNASRSLRAVEASVTGAADPGTVPVYVQNPFTGEYLLAKARAVADGAIERFSNNFALDNNAGGLA